MDAEEILTIARTATEPPESWTVIPLNQQITRQAAILWTGGSLVGFGLMIWLYIAVANIFSFYSIQFFFMLVLGFIGVGSAFVVVGRVRKLLDADHYLIVLTPEVFVQQRGKTITEVPLRNVANLTLRGVFGGNVAYTQYDERDPRNAAFSLNQMLGGRQTQRARRTPDSLAFIDTRTDSPVIIAEDNSFGELPIIEELIRQYVESMPRARIH